MPVWWRKTTTDPARADILPTGEKKVKKRYEWFDNAKGFLIYCVILGHVVERFLSRSWLAGRIQLWIYLFHMPAFVFLAGLFSKRAVMECRVDKALSYLFLFYFLKAAFYAAGIYVKGAENAEFLLFTESGIPWFCLAMCWWYLAAILTRSLSPAIVLTGSLVLSAITGYFPIDGSFLVLFRTFNFFPFFYLGYLTDPAQLRQLTQNKAARIAGALILTAAMGMCFLFYGKADKLLMLLRGRYRYEEIGKELCGIGGCFCRMTIFILSGIMILSFFCVIPREKTPLALIGIQTLPVYAFHGLFITILIGRFRTIRDWMLSGHLFLHCVLFSLLVLCLTLLPPFGWIARFIMRLPAAAAEKTRARDDYK